MTADNALSLKSSLDEIKHTLADELKPCPAVHRLSYILSLPSKMLTRYYKISTPRSVNCNHPFVHPEKFHKFAV